MHLKQTPWAALLLLGVCTLAGGQLNNIECPFPGGQGEASEAECGTYTACQWTDGQCHMVDNLVGGYVVDSQPEDTSRGFKVNLRKSDPTVTMFGQDIPNLIFEVFYHENYHLQVKIYCADVVRYEVPVPLHLPEAADPDPGYSLGVSGMGEPFSFNVTRNSNGNTLFRTVGSLTFEDQFIQIHTLLASTYLYGFGENTHLSFRHQFEPRATFPIFARDQPVGTDPMNEYGHHPYYMVMEDDPGNSHSVLLYNSNAMEYSTFLLEDGSPALTLRTIGGILDFHFFLGPTPEELNVQYGSMVGFPAFPPYWALGFHLSRWGYNSTDGVRAARERMRSLAIPQDVQTLDIDYMERYRDFTYDPVNWGDLPDLVEELHNDNVKLTLILDPAIVTDFENYEPVVRGKAADAFIKWSDPSLVPDDQPAGTDDYMVGYVWPDTKTVFPDFLKPETQAWWGNEIKLFHEAVNFDALWIDMNEPANFGTNLEKPWNWPPGQEPWSLKCPDNKWNNPPYPTNMINVGDNQSKRITDHSICMTANQTDGNTTYLHYDVHSIYGWAETVTTYNTMLELFPGTRPVLLSRSTFPGSGQYAIHWLGDNAADWTHMKMSIVGMFEFNMFGFPMVGADVCGFFGEPDMEMCARWMEVGAFYPFSRNHNTNGMADQDPGMWPEVAEISRFCLNIRYKYLPYLYSLFHRAHMHGASVIRPLLNVFPDDIVARDVDDQFLWGDGIMVVPVLEKGVVARDIYFPKGEWYHLVPGWLAATGPVTQTAVSVPLQNIMLYVRGGVILPYQDPSINTVESRQNPFGLTVALDTSTNEAHGELFWDSGDGEHVMSESYMAYIDYNANNTLTSNIMHGVDVVAGLQFEVINIYGAPSNPTAIRVNAVALPESDWTYIETDRVLTIRVTVPLGEGLLVDLTY